MAKRGNPQNLKPFVKGHDPRRNLKGRPEKFWSQISALGYHKDEAVQTIKNLAGADPKEIERLSKSTNSKDSALEKMIARMMKKVMAYGDAYTFETLMNRAYGAPDQRQEVKMINEISFKDAE